MTGTRAKRNYLFCLLLNAKSLENRNLFLNQRVGCFRFSNKLATGYINLAFKHNDLLEPIFLLGTGAANQANIGIKALNDMPIPLPPLNEQQRIVAKVEQLMKLYDDLEQSIQQNQKYTQDLLQVALKEALEPNKANS